jgi:hypothetical protein
VGDEPENGTIMTFMQMLCGPLRRGCRAAGLVVSLCVVWLWVTPADGYVLKGPHIIDLMIRKLAGAKTLQVDQLVMVEDPALAGQPVEIQETLRYIFPNHFRSDMQLENTHRTFVFSLGRSLTVVDGAVTPDRGGRFNRYKDLFLYNSRHLLHKILSTHGVDVGVTSLGRLEDRVVFVIGAHYPDDSVSQLWVDKERFVPLRWINVISSGALESEPERFDFVYRNWQNVDDIWYPMQIDTFHNQTPIRQIRVTKVQADAVISGELMNISHLETLYRQEERPPSGDVPQATDIDEVQRTLEEFKKKFDP